MKQRKTIVIGGGPAGIMAAITAKNHVNDVLLMEKNSELGKKLKITGGGRCNVTNDSTPAEIMENVVSGKKFLTKSLNAFTSKDLINLIENYGCPLKVEEGGCVFPKSNNSKDIIDVLHKILNDKTVKLMFNTEVSKILTERDLVVGVLLSNGKKIKADHVVLATGGVSYPETGSTGKGHQIAKELGHTITNLKPGLVPMEIKEKWLTELSGITFENIVLKYKPGKSNKIKTIVGNLLLTHFGISGPAALNLSSFLNDIEIGPEGKEITIDFLPDYSEKKLQEELIFYRETNKQISNVLSKYLPKNFICKLLEKLQIDSSTPINHLSKKDRNKLISSLKNFKITFLKFKSIKEATVTSGGISLKEVNPFSMESKLVKGLYFAGELLDIDAISGGYNLQIAFSTGYIAGLLESNKK